jgi:hypothetical protein
LEESTDGEGVLEGRLLGKLERKLTIGEGNNGNCQDGLAGGGPQSSGKLGIIKYYGTFFEFFFFFCRFATKAFVYPKPQPRLELTRTSCWGFLFPRAVDLI